MRNPLRSPRVLIPAGLLWILGMAGPAGAEPVAEVPSVVLRDVPFSFTLSDPDLEPGTVREIRIEGLAEDRTVVLAPGEAVVVEGARLTGPLRLVWDGGSSVVAVRVVAGWMSLLPPLVAIVLAILFRQVVVALLVGVWLGAMLIFGANPLDGFLRTFDVFVVGALADSDHVRILVFSFLLGGMLGVIQRMGGAQGIVGAVSPYARSPRSGQLSTWVMGLLIFFDDYANSLLVGSTMRHLTDKLRISREKLAYIVDSTAAPVASIAIISTWIGVEVGLIQASFDELGLERDGFAAFVGSLPYRFYPIFALAFGFMVAVMGRDFGPMLRAERRARHQGKVLRDGAMPLTDFEGDALQPPEDKPHRWINAILPVMVVIGGVLFFIFTGGKQAAMEAGGPVGLKEIVGSADSYSALLWASALGLATAVLLGVGQRILSLSHAVEAAVLGIKSMLLAAIILVLAWSIGSITGDLHTASFLVHLLGDTLAPHWLPVLVFIFAGLTSFATGSSWGTMGILVPLVIPLAHTMAPGSEIILMGAISSVLAGAVWGDHCSPISDTTVLSSMASSSDHMDHVNTQLPYALVVGVVGMVVGDVPTAFGVPYWVSWGIGLVILFLVLRFWGRKVEEA